MTHFCDRSIMRPAGESDTDGEGDIEECRGGVLYSWARGNLPDQGIDLGADDSLEDAEATEDDARDW